MSNASVNAYSEALLKKKLVYSVGYGTVKNIVNVGKMQIISV